MAALCLLAMKRFPFPMPALPLIVSMATYPVAAVAADARPVSAGIFGNWGAFRDADGTRCYAIAEPSRTTAGTTEKPFASVGVWPRRSMRARFYVRLSHMPADKSAVYLSIGERRFALSAARGEARAQGSAMDAAIIAAIRETETMSVEGKGRNGRAFSDLYILKGAATAIDAMLLACR